ncbi:MAG: acyltransferase family protein [Gammaproteobacteria bacterium]
MKYRAEIDGLRALAVLPVILFHAGFEWFDGGFVGVDVFFVISGYLITTIIISEMAEGKFSIVNFYERRARRILPALFFVMAVCLPFAWVWLTPNDLKDFGQSLVAVSTFSSNILFWLESGYFDRAAELKPLLHTWSLAVEEQYYILFPIFLILTWRLGIKWILVLLSFVFLLSLGIAQWGAYNKPSATFFLLPTRGWELLVGVFAAFYLKYNTHLKSHTLNQVFSMLGFGMIVYSIIAFDKTTPFPSFYALIPTIGTGLLILCTVPRTYIHKLLSLNSIVRIGLISYSAYLWHQPLLAFARAILGDVSDPTLISLCIASLAMAWFSWRFVEGPFRNKNQTTRKFIFTFSILGMTAFSLIGISTHFSNGFLNRFSEEEQKILSFKSYDYRFNYREGVCFLKPEHKDFFKKECFSGKNLIWGDSHAAALSYGLREINSFSQLTSSGCPPIINQYFPTRPFCLEINNRVLEYVKKGSFTEIYLHSNWSYYDISRISMLSETIDEILLIDPNIIIKIIGGVPKWRPSLPDVLLRAGTSMPDNNNTVVTVENEFLNKVEAFDKEIIRLLGRYKENNNVQFISLLNKFCEEKSCMAITFNCGVSELTTWDYGHLTANGSKIAAGFIFNESIFDGSQCSD